MSRYTVVKTSSLIFNKIIIDEQKNIVTIFSYNKFIFNNKFIIKYYV